MTIKEILAMPASDLMDVDVSIKFESSGTTANEFVAQPVPIRVGGSFKVEVITNDD